MQPQLLLGTAVLFLASLGGCSSLVEAEMEARFVLKSIEGDPVPAVWAKSEHGKSEIVADTLAMETSRRGVRKVTYRSTDAAGTVNTYAAEEPFSYTLVGGRIEISFDCRDVIVVSASCVAPPHMVGRVDEAGALLDAFFGKPLRYRRI